MPFYLDDHAAAARGPAPNSIAPSPHPSVHGVVSIPKADQNGVPFTTSDSMGCPGAPGDELVRVAPEQRLVVNGSGAGLHPGMRKWVHASEAETLRRDGVIV